MIRLAVKIAYLGDDHFGSQIQPGLRTVEGEVLSDLRVILKMSDDDIGLKIASRTDRGVNALGNVIVFNSCIEDADILLRALNAVSSGIFYRSAAKVDEDFNPRFANLRSYRYIMPSENMDLEKMRACADLFLGEHDLRRFCRPDGKDTLLTIHSISLQENNGLIFLDICARYFLWNMIRRITAAIMSVGSGSSDISDVKRALDGEDLTFGLSRPDALTLMDIVYEGIEFVSPNERPFDKRSREETFRNRLREQFFESL